MKLESRIGIILLALAIPAFVIPFFVLGAINELVPNFFTVLDYVVPAMVIAGAGLVWDGWRRDKNQETSQSSNKVRLLREYYSNIFVELAAIEASPRMLTPLEFEMTVRRMQAETHAAMLYNAHWVKTKEGEKKFKEMESLQGEIISYAIAKLQAKLNPTTNTRSSPPVEIRSEE